MILLLCRSACRAPDFPIRSLSGWRRAVSAGPIHGEPLACIGRTYQVMPSAERSRLPVAFGAGLVIVTLLIGVAVLLSRYSTPAGQEFVEPLPQGPSEHAHAPPNSCL